MLAIDALAPYARNSRTHDDAQVAQIAASIREFGFTNPVLVDGGGGIIAGHGRVMAARSLGLGEVPCVRLAHLTDAQKRAYVIADNKLALNAGWDDELLSIEMQELKDVGFDLSLLGFNDEEIASIKKWQAPEDKIPELQKIEITRLHDVWLMDDHRLTCADTTDLEAMARLMGQDIADMVWTDPPYNVDYHQGEATIKNDAMQDEEFYNLLCLSFLAMFKSTKLGGCIYIAHSESNGINFRNAMAASGWMQKQCLIWVKNAIVLGRQDYNWKHEPILYGWKPGASHYFCNDFTLHTIIDDDVDVQKMKAPELREVIKKLRNAIATTVIREDKPHRSDLHPTMKPVALVEGMIRNSSRAGEIVLDGFGGGGSTLIASTKLGRKARIVEIDPVYADVIVRRWQDFTGQSATLSGTNKTFEEIAGERSKT